MTSDMEKAKGYVGISKFRKNYIKKKKTNRKKVIATCILSIFIHKEI